MRSLVLAIWVFINLIFFGVCIYMYLLWSFYWMSDMKDQPQSTTLDYDQAIFEYNRGFPNYEENSKIKKNAAIEKRKKVSTFTFLNNSQPRFLNFQSDFLIEIGNEKYGCQEKNKEENLNKCEEKTISFKQKLISELNKVLLVEGNVLKEKNNSYNVTFSKAKNHYLERPAKEILKTFLHLNISTLKKKDFDLIDNHFKNYLPRKQLFENRFFKTCAIVASSGSLLGSNLGKLIDSHNVVVRFNNAPTENFESDVGKKTTLRVVNSYVVSKDDFLNSKLYENVTLLTWDPSNFSSNLSNWYQKPEHNFFSNYLKHKKKYPKSRFFIVNPKAVWDLWTFLQSNMSFRMRKNPTSSGFLGISILLPHCDILNVFEYVPSVRLSKKCHYYDVVENPSCTFGSWHPLAAEKLLIYYLNVANDTTVFQSGFVQIPGYT